MPAPSWWSTPCRRWRQDAFTFFAMIWPTRPKLADQTILAQWDPRRQAGFRIGISEGGRLSVTLGDGAGATATLTHGPARCWSGNGIGVRVAIDPGDAPGHARPAAAAALCPDRRCRQFQRGCRHRAGAPSTARSISRDARKPTGRWAAISTARSTGRCSCPGFIRRRTIRRFSAIRRMRRWPPRSSPAGISRRRFRAQGPSISAAADITAGSFIYRPAA